MIDVTSVRTISWRLVPAAILAAAPALGAQSLGDRIGSVRDGTVSLTYASRPTACGDGDDLVSLGSIVTYPGMRSHGRTGARCLMGPAHVTVTRRGGEIAAIRVRIAAVPRTTSPGTDLGTVPAPAAAEYFLALARTSGNRVADAALMAAAVADSADIWQRLLALARDDAVSREVRSNALFWMSGVAPAEAAVPLTALARRGNEARPIREAAIMTLSQLADGAGVSSLIALTARDDAEDWVRERAIFWLGNADDERARATLRTLAESDTLHRRLRDQAIFALGFLDGRDETNGAFLRGLYGRLEDTQLKDKVIQAVAQRADEDDERWLDARVTDTAERVDLRKQALFWRGQQRETEVADLIALSPRLESRELRTHYAFVLSQRRESAALDKLIDLARNDPDRAVREKAVFWLGQVRDPRAVRFLEERISR